MSFIGDLFGGSEQTSTPTDVTPEEFKALRGPVADALRNLFGGGGQQLDFAGGTFGGVTDPSRFTAGLAPQESDLLTRIGSLTGAPSPALTGAQSFLTSQLGGAGLSPESNPFLAATIAAAQRPLIEQFQDIQLPNLISQFTGAGQRVQPGGSSAFDRAGAIASRGLASALGDISTGISSQNFQAERGRQQQAVTQASQLQTADVQNTIQGLQAVALPRLIEQFGIDRGLEEFNRRITTVLQAIQLAQGLPLQTIATEQTQTQQPNIFGGIAGLFPQGLATPFGLGPT